MQHLLGYLTCFVLSVITLILAGAVLMQTGELE
jgi:hypothetical protein